MMKSTLLLLYSNTCILLLFASSFLSNVAQSSFVSMEWMTEVLQTKQCELASTYDFGNALATVEQLVKSNDMAPSLPKSCMEIKESSPVSPSGYYTISNGSESSVVVYCNMYELYFCPSLEKTLKGFSDNLVSVSSTLATNSAF